MHQKSPIKHFKWMQFCCSINSVQWRNNDTNNEVLFPSNLLLATSTTYYNLLLNLQLLWCLTWGTFNWELRDILEDYNVKRFDYKSDWKQMERKYWQLKYFLIENSFGVLLRSCNTKRRIDIKLKLILTYWCTLIHKKAL